jgi:sugar (pentulose or hexulose) kinase
MEYILTIDAGTTSIKCGIFDTRLKPLGFRAGEYQLMTPDPYTVEADPQVYISKVMECMAHFREEVVDTDWSA